MIVRGYSFLTIREGHVSSELYQGQFDVRDQTSIIFDFVVVFLIKSLQLFSNDLALEVSLLVVVITMFKIVIEVLFIKFKEVENQKDALRDMLKYLKPF